MNRREFLVEAGAAAALAARCPRSFVFGDLGSQHSFTMAILF